MFIFLMHFSYDWRIEAVGFSKNRFFSLSHGMRSVLMHYDFSQSIVGFDVTLSNKEMHQILVFFYIKAVFTPNPPLQWREAGRSHTVYIQNFVTPSCDGIGSRSVTRTAETKKLWWPSQLDPRGSHWKQEGKAVSDLVWMHPNTFCGCSWWPVFVFFFLM